MSLPVSKKHMTISQGDRKGQNMNMSYNITPSSIISAFRTKIKCHLPVKPQS